MAEDNHEGPRPVNVELQVPEIHERIIGGVKVKFVSVEHYAKPETYPWEQIRKLIKSPEGITKVVAEYFLPELEEAVFNDSYYVGTKARQVAEDRGIPAFSKGLEEIAREEAKNILVMDPANSFIYDVHEVIIPGSLMLGGGLSALAGFYDRWIAKKGGYGSHKNEPLITRRQALARIILGGAALTAGTQAWFPDQLAEGGRTVNTKDARRGMIAEGLRQYGGSHKNENLLLFYPKRHVEGILHYVDNPEQPGFFKRAAYWLIPGITRDIREYKPDAKSGTWSKISSTRIK